MEFKFVVVLITVLFNAKKGVECNKKSLGEDCNIATIQSREAVINHFQKISCSTVVRWECRLYIGEKTVLTPSSVITTFSKIFHMNGRIETDEDIVAVAGCNISLKWILPSTTRNLLLFNIFSSYKIPIATSSSGLNCDVRDDSSMLCNIYSIDDDRMIVVLTILNVTAGQSGNYTLWTKTRFREQNSNTTKKLVVIGKPNIIEVRKPIFGLPFQMTCNATYEQEGYLYRWRINDIERTTVYNGNAYTISSIGMNDTFSNVTCKICLNKNTSTLSSKNWENYICSKDSDPYTIQLLYGPNNVSLSREERHFYLNEHDIFSIDCFANCYPNCIFWWKGRVTIESQNLNITFESRMAGQYACHVTNQQTKMTLISDTITLHHAKEDHNYEENNLRGILPNQLWMATVIVSVLLLINGLLMIVIIRRINTTRSKESRQLSQPCVRETQCEASKTELEKHIQPTHIISTKVRAFKRKTRLECPNDLSEDNLRPNPQEEHYHAIDEGDLSDDDFSINILIHDSSEKKGKISEQTQYNYAYSIETCHAETVDLNAAHETHLTTSSDRACIVETFPDEVNDERGTDHAYLTLIDDHVNSI